MASSVNSFKNRNKNYRVDMAERHQELEKEAPGPRNSLRGPTSYLGHWESTHNKKNNNDIITEASKIIKIKFSPQTPIVGEILRGLAALSKLFRCVDLECVMQLKLYIVNVSLS